MIECVCECVFKWCVYECVHNMTEKKIQKNKNK